MTVRALCLVLGVWLCACNTEERTQVMLTVDSDLEVPAELDALRIRVEAPDGEVQQAGANLGRGEPGLPRSLALLHEGGALGPFEVRVRGLLADTVVVQREARFTFQEGRTLALALNLVRRCVDVTCDEGQTCAEQGCRNVRVQADELTPWTGEAPTLGDGGRPDARIDSGPTEDGGNLPEAGPDAAPGDSGGPDAATDGSEPDGSASDAGGPDAQPDAMPDAEVDACVPSSEQCNEEDDDCDGLVDEDFDLQGDGENCGQCGMSCGDDICTNGSCQACPAGRLDCDQRAATDCEVDGLNNKQHCGACNNRCFGALRCVNGVCQ